MVSENAVVICDAGGIFLYHIPELSSTVLRTLSPIWEWLGESKWFCGSVCTMSSQHPVLYLQGASGTHTITFRMVACGRDPVVAKHHITGKLLAHLVSLEGDDHLSVMKRRKGLYYGEEIPDEFATYLLGREELTGRFIIDIRIPGGSLEDDHEIRLVDFDERTGRILIGTNWYGFYGPEGIRIHLADLPP